MNVYEMQIELVEEGKQDLRNMLKSGEINEDQFIELIQKLMDLKCELMMKMVEGSL